MYNEESRFDPHAFTQFAKRGIDFHFVFVNDCSTDKTGKIIEDLASSQPQSFSTLHLPHNQGKAEAVRQGILFALGKMKVDSVGYLDADLATPLEEIQKFSKILTETPQLVMVLGARVMLLGRNIARNPWRHYLGRIFATVASWVLNLPVYDTQCGAKLIRAIPELHDILSRPFRSRWIFDVELIARLCLVVRSRGLSVSNSFYEYPLENWQDVRGSKLKLKDFIRSIFEMMGIWLQYHNALK
jgi:dolichyl-phosphate beta-glucosyltransferase